MDNDVAKRLMNAVDSRFEEQTSFLAELATFPSTRGHEHGAQRFMADRLVDLGYETDSWQIEVSEIAHLPGFSPVIGDYDDAVNVVATHRGRSGNGRTLILNGHIDVVPTGPLEMWSSPPFAPRIEDGYMYGRGVGDMKAGLVANLYALGALKALGYQPAADVYFQSVVEEECTGNGMLACLQRGYRADAALIPEPFAEQLVSAQVGVIWFQLVVKGKPVHVLEAASGFNAIDASLPLIAALKELEQRWNRPERAHPHYRCHEHPLNLNIGKIQGGDWASSVPAWCRIDVRMGIYPGQDIDAARAEIEACIRDAANRDPYLRKNHPEIIYNGFLAEGYCLADDDRPATRLAIETLAQAHRSVTGQALGQTAITATTDARFAGLYAGTPALVYGPAADAIHGFNERVELESVRRVTQSIALFIAGWCGLERV